MKRLAALAASLLLAASASFAAEETVTFKSGTENVSAFLAKPDGPGPFPAVIVLHEWWGLDAWIKDQARALAREGYVALALDLYRGKVTANAEEAHQLMMGTPIDRQNRDMKAAFAFLKARKDVVPAKIASVGWCMGGRNALTLAVEEPTPRRRRGLLRRPAHRPGLDREDQSAHARQLRRRRRGTVARAGEGVRGRGEEGGKDLRPEDLRGRAPRVRQSRTTRGRATARTRPVTPGRAPPRFLRHYLIVK